MTHIYKVQNQKTYYNEFGHEQHQLQDGEEEHQAVSVHGQRRREEISSAKYFYILDIK